MKTITSEIAIRKLKPIEGKRFYEKAIDGEGLRIIVYRSGKKKFEYRYTIERMKDGELKKVKEHYSIGFYPTVSLGEAREIHRQLVKDRRNAVDIKAKRDQKKTKDLMHPTLEQLVESYYKIKQDSLINAKEPHGMIKNHIVSRIGYKKVNAIDTPTLMDTFQAIIKDGKAEYLIKLKKKVKELNEDEEIKYHNLYTTTANRCLTQLKAIFAYAVKRRIIKYSPAQILGRSDAGGEESPRSRYLSFDEIKIFLTKLDDVEMSLAVKQALKVVLFSGKRIGETRLAKKQHLDFKNRVWTIPFANIKKTKSNKKQKKDDKVYLSDSLIGIFKEMKENGNSDYIFESPEKEGSPIQTRTVNRAIDRKLETFELKKFTTHDLRRSVGTNMVEIGILPHVKEKILNHSIKGIEGVYDHSKQWDEKVKAWKIWESRIYVIMNSEKVIPINSKKKA
jgi:integrase